jgi:hypothetical protein
VTDDIRSLVAEGLYEENLTQIAELCDARFDTNPTLYGTLGYMCRTLAEEYGNQAILTERYDMVMQIMQPRLLALLDVVSESPHIFLERLTDLWRAFRAVAI